MLGAATRAASGLVRQSIAGNVSKALPAVANRKLYLLSYFYPGKLMLKQVFYELG